ncbi:MAG: PASTA domain-containing protein [Ignavibacteriae bacterium]|nr:PASTA domain-containing protein [Ignavibacteriota bacterium]
MIKKIIILAVVLTFLFILFNFVIMPWYVKHTSLVKVPNVIGLQFNEAKKVLEKSGLDVKQGDVRYDESKPIGLVMDQNPMVDQTVKNGRRIYLTVCGGEQLVEVPKLVGRTLRDAKFTLEQRNLQVGEIMKKFTNEYAEDVVVSQVVQPGSKVKKLSRVDLIISNGQQIGDIMIPDVIGKKLEEARKILIEKKLTVGKITYQASDLPSGQIVDQYPKKDKSAKENTPIELFIAKKRKTENEVQEVSSENQGENEKKGAEKIKAEEKEKLEKEKKEKLDKETQKEKLEKDKTKEKQTDKDKIDKTKDKPKEKPETKQKENK